MHLLINNCVDFYISSQKHLMDEKDQIVKQITRAKHAWELLQHCWKAIQKDSSAK